MRRSFRQPGETNGPLVSSITFRHPALLAKEALTIDHISEGRLELGVGAGGASNDFEMTGLSAWERPERTRRFREFVTMLETTIPSYSRRALAQAVL